MSSSKKPEERIDAAQRNLKSLRRRFQFGTWMTVIIGFGLLALVSFYFYYGYKEISDLKDPELIVSLVGDTVDSQIPQLATMAKDQVDTNATVWAEQASQQALAQLPTLREWLEQAACKQADRGIKELDVVGEEKFRELLRNNRDTVARAIQDVKDDDEVSDGVVVLLEEALEKELGLGLQEQADVLFTLLNDMGENMELLQEGENLSDEQKAELRVLMLARRWQQETFGDVRFAPLELKPVETLVEEMERERLKKGTSDK